MDMSHNFQFKWNNHITQLSQAFSELRNDETHCDTTLVTEEGCLLKVHGAVMIATSRYFEYELANVTPEQHPIVVLDGIKYPELSHILDYIYQGEIQVEQHLMKNVLEAADYLQIKGLTNMKNNLSIKKLIAPSPSVAQASNSAPCSPHSKSPSPSPPLRTHSPSCHSPSGDVYPHSFTLKPDTEEANVEAECANLTHRHTYSDKAVGSERPIDAVGTSNNAIFSASSEYLEQNLGIDLSVSKVSCEGNGKRTGKIFSHEDTHVRKRKIMKSLEEGSSANESEFSRLEEEKCEDLMPLKKKINLPRSVLNRQTLIWIFCFVHGMLLIK